MKVIRNMPFADYQAAEGINASSIKAGVTSMLHMRSAMTKGYKESTAAMQFGKLAHAAILEPLVLVRDCTVWDGGDKRGSDWKAFKAENGHKEIVSENELAKLNAVVSAVQANADAHRLITGSQHEVSCFWEDESYGLAKARLDGYFSGGIVEVKTLANISQRAMSNQFVNMGYDIQAGWYQHAAMVCGLCMAKTVYMVYVESVEPFDVAVFTVPVRAITKGYETAEEIANRYRISEAEGLFLGVQDGAVRDLEMPAYYEGDVELDDIMPME